MNTKPKYEHLKVYKFKPGSSGNPAGRPKSYITVLKELGYTKPVIATMVAEIMFLTESEVWKIIKSEHTEPIIRVAIARAFSRAAYKGEYKYIADYMNILFGKPMPFIPEIPVQDNESKSSLEVK
ncbi:MAG TPA: DUF5681 domain-containing protein [Bacteroidia bacterium]|jgi:hypothetical protein|nr:DUF5681 domain-containing protein [Bacteroidia bacterium]